MSNFGFISVAPELAVIEAKVDLVDSVVDAVRAVDVLGLAAEHAAIAAAVAGIVVKSELEIVQGSINDNNYVTLVDVSGQGIFYYAVCNAAAATNGWVKVTIDGWVTEISDLTNTKKIIAVASLVETDTTSIIALADTDFNKIKPVEFKNNFKFEHKEDGATAFRSKVIYGVN